MNINNLNAARSAAITRLDARAVRELPPMYMDLSNQLWMQQCGKDVY